MQGANPGSHLRGTEQLPCCAGNCTQVPPTAAACWGNTTASTDHAPAGRRTRGDQDAKGCSPHQLHFFAASCGGDSLASLRSRSCRAWRRAERQTGSPVQTPPESRFPEECRELLKQQRTPITAAAVPARNGQQCRSGIGFPQKSFQHSVMTLLIRPARGATAVELEEQLIAPHRPGLIVLLQLG